MTVRVVSGIYRAIFQNHLGFCILEKTKNVEFSKCSVHQGPFLPLNFNNIDIT